MKGLEGTLDPYVVDGRVEPDVGPVRCCWKGIGSNFNWKGIGREGLEGTLIESRRRCWKGRK